MERYLLPNDLDCLHTITVFCNSVIACQSTSLPVLSVPVHSLMTVGGMKNKSGRHYSNHGYTSCTTCYNYEQMTKVKDII